MGPSVIRDLRKEFYTKGSLKGAIFKNSNLSNISLFGANLENADFTGADLSLANLGQANLEGANLTQVRPGSTPYFSYLRKNYSMRRQEWDLSRC